jgi:hypothetical protein
MTKEKIFKWQESVSEIINLTIKMLEIIETTEENYEGLLILLEQRQLAMYRFEQLFTGKIYDKDHDINLVKELLDLDYQLKQKIKAKYQELRKAVTGIQQHKASLDLYKKKGSFAEGLFLDNKR